jgi:DnaJ homolog subfamily B member 12
LIKDKCNAPGTDDAFKAIAGAFSVLGDADKKSNYDRYGIDSAESASAGNRSSSQPFRGFGGDDFNGQVSPEELFRMFMGGDQMGGQFPGFSTCN